MWNFARDVMPEHWVCKTRCREVHYFLKILDGAFQGAAAAQLRWWQLEEHLLDSAQIRGVPVECQPP